MTLACSISARPSAAGRCSPATADAPRSATAVRGELGAGGPGGALARPGTGSTGATTFDGLKRAGQNMVDAVLRTAGGSNRILLADFDSGSSADNNFGSSAPLSMEAMIGPGDSGGGLFELLNGHNYLTGI